MPLDKVQLYKSDVQKSITATEKEITFQQRYANELENLNSHEEQYKARTISFDEDRERIFQNATPAEPVKEIEGESRSVRKKREAMQKQYTKALKAQLESKVQESDSFVKVARTYAHRQAEEIINGTAEINFFDLEDTIVEKKIKSIDEIEKSNLAVLEFEQALKKQNNTPDDNDPKNSLSAKTLKIKLDAQNARVAAYTEKAKMLPPESKEREKMMEKVEKEILKADHLKREHKVAVMPAGKEKDRDAATIKRHDKFDFLKRIFRKPNKYSKADAKMEISKDERIGIREDLQLVNIGRATMGGTKAMYNFADYSRGVDVEPQIWLYKEATNCIGMAKPEGAVVTEAASQLQEKVRGFYSIPAKCVRDEQGKVIGSIQQKIIPVQSNVNLFKWQANPDDSLPESTVSDLMKEHILDWTLCNFDTKGENFLMQGGGHIISFDKEASFNHLLDKEAQTMSYSYKPHSNDTIYNTMFKGFIEGKLDLDFYAAEEAIEKIEAISDQEFLDMFRETFDVKYGTEGSKRREAEAALLKRKNNLREDCRRFYTDLLKERIKAIDKDENLSDLAKEQKKISMYTLLVHRKKNESNFDDTKPLEFTFRNESREIIHVGEDVYFNANENALYRRAEWVMKHPVNTDPNVISGPL